MVRPLGLGCARYSAPPLVAGTRRCGGRRPGYTRDAHGQHYSDALIAGDWWIMHRNDVAIVLQDGPTCGLVGLCAYVTVRPILILSVLLEVTACGAAAQRVPWPPRLVPGLPVHVPCSRNSLCMQSHKAGPNRLEPASRNCAMRRLLTSSSIRHTATINRERCLALITWQSLQGDTVEWMQRCRPHAPIVLYPQHTACRRIA